MFPRSFVGVKRKHRYSESGTRMRAISVGTGVGGAVGGKVGGDVGEFVGAGDGTGVG